MGVKGLWTVLEPSSKPIRLESLAGKTLAIDASIWIYQFIKARRDNTGNMIHGAHISGFFQRICKLLYHGIQPVFVFDGVAPELKRRTVTGRRNRREQTQERVDKTAERLLSIALKKSLLSESPILPKKRDRDEYELPAPLASLPQNDLRLATHSDLTAFVDSHTPDLDSLNINSESFKALPIELQHEIVVELKNKARAPNASRVDDMLARSETMSDFSKEQIKHLVHRNVLTQRVMRIAQYGDESHKEDEGKVVRIQKRVAGTRNRDFVLKKDERNRKALENAKGTGRIVHGLDGMLGFASKSFIENNHWEDVKGSDYVDDDTPFENVLDLVSPLDSYLSKPPQETLPSQEQRIQMLLQNTMDLIPDNTEEILPEAMSLIYTCAFDDSPAQLKSRLLQAEKQFGKSIPGSKEQLVRRWIKEFLESLVSIKSDQVIVLSDFEDETFIPSHPVIPTRTSPFIPTTPEPVKKTGSFPISFEDDDDEFVVLKSPFKQQEILLSDGSVSDEEEWETVKVPSIPLSKSLDLVNDSIEILDDEDKPIVIDLSQDDEPFHLQDTTTIHVQETTRPAQKPAEITAQETKNLPQDSQDILEDDEFEMMMQKEADAFEEFVSSVSNKELVDQLDQEASRLMIQQRKQIRDASDVTTNMVLETQELLKLFGLPFVTAPTEAEAQCAFLESSGCVHGIVTDDSDV